MISKTQLQHNHDFISDVQRLLDANENSKTLTNKKSTTKTLRGRLAVGATQNATNTIDCDPSNVQLLDYPQWQAEKGYWIGEYTFLGGNGNPYVSSTWNYPYDQYKGFITGDVVG